jgi:transposase
MKEVPFARNYKITTQGQVYSNLSNKVLTPAVIKGGYLRIRIVCDDGVQRSFLVHRLVALTYIPNPENKPEVNHINGIKTDNNLSNLEWVTREENQQHAFSTGLNNNLGESNGRALLSSDQVLDIYWKLYNGARNSDIAKEYNLSTTTVMEIKSKVNWTEITKNLPDIPIKPKSERLSEKTVEWICQMIEKGVGPKEIYDLCNNKSVKLDHIYDIKRRRGFKHISCKYNW